MDFHIEQRFPAPRAAVEGALVDEAYIARLGGLARLGEPRLLQHRDDGRHVHQQVRYRFVGELNSRVRRFVDPARLTWVEDAVFDRAAHRTSIRILPDHYRELLHCSIDVSFVAKGEEETVRVAEGSIEIPIPIFGRQAEAAIVSGMREHAEAEIPVLLDWLTTQTG